MNPDRDAIALAERVLAVLKEGSFSATYKFALFMSILDVCLENSSRHGLPPSVITTRQLAEKVVEMYWNHSCPYGERGVLRQGGVTRGGQAEIVRRIERARARWADSQSDTLFRTRQAHPDEFRRLVDFVEWKLIEMPIPRLQVLGRQEDRFLYEFNWTQQIRQATISAYQRGARTTFDNRLLLRDGVAEDLIRLNGVLRPLFQRQWALMVAAMNGLPEDDLERFLFDAGRTPPDALRGPLGELQQNRCFYCGERLDARAEVDHFIPWARYPDDGVDNLVVANRRCNNSKRDFLAAAEHVERWTERTRALDGELASAARGASWRRDATRTVAVARATYLRLPSTARLWLRPSEFAPVDHGRIARALER